MGVFSWQFLNSPPTGLVWGPVSVVLLRLCEDAGGYLGYYCNAWGYSKGILINIGRVTHMVCGNEMGLARSKACALTPESLWSRENKSEEELISFYIN